MFREMIGEIMVPRPKTKWIIEIMKVLCLTKTAVAIELLPTWMKQVPNQITTSETRMVGMV